MKNQVIKNVNKETAKQIKNYWIDKGVYESKMYDYIFTEDDGDAGIYYGVIDGTFDYYTLKEVQEANAEIIELNDYPKMMLVWDRNENDAEETFVLFYKYGFYWVTEFEKSIEEINNSTSLMAYKYAKDIEEPKEIVITMEEATEIIAKEKGTTSNLIRIKK